MIEIGQDGLLEVPSDIDARYSLGILIKHRDVFLQLLDENTSEDDWWPYQIIRFRAPDQGAQIPIIAAEFYSVERSFKKFEGRIPSQVADSSAVMRYVSLPPTLQVRTSQSPNEPRINIIGITDDEQGGDEAYSRWMDIAISQIGDATIAFREKGYDPKTYEEMEQRGSITFKAEPNGGRYPIMAFAITRMAESIAQKARGRRRR